MGMSVKSSVNVGSAVLHIGENTKFTPRGSMTDADLQFLHLEMQQELIAKQAKEIFEKKD